MHQDAHKSESEHIEIITIFGYYCYLFFLDTKIRETAVYSCEFCRNVNPSNSEENLNFIVTSSYSYFLLLLLFSCWQTLKIGFTRTNQMSFKAYLY